MRRRPWGTDEMQRKNLILAGALAASLVAGAANAEVIAGPTLDTNGFGWVITGLSFTANVDTALIGFDFQNQGQADRVILTDTAGTILDAISTPAGTPTYHASVNWSLSAGQTYWLLQTVEANELYTLYGSSLPSNSDISIVNVGSYGHTLSETLNAGNFGPTDYWAGFNCIATGNGGACGGNGSSAPEPAAWSLMILGFGAAGAMLRRRAAPAAA
jgi:opacity protein-like surface antigen